MNKALKMFYLNFGYIENGVKEICTGKSLVLRGYKFSNRHNIGPYSVSKSVYNSYLSMQHTLVLTERRIILITIEIKVAYQNKSNLFSSRLCCSSFI